MSTVSTTGTLDDVAPKVKHFLYFVDGLPVKDDWVDKLKDLIAKLKQDERGKLPPRVKLDRYYDSLQAVA